MLLSKIYYFTSIHLLTCTYPRKLRISQVPGMIIPGMNFVELKETMDIYPVKISLALSVNLCSTSKYSCLILDGLALKYALVFDLFYDPASSQLSFDPSLAHRVWWRIICVAYGWLGNSF